MTKIRKPFTAIPMDESVLQELQRDPFLAARDQLGKFLIRYTLIDSYDNFRTARSPYPFVPISSLRPGTVAPAKEYDLQNNALVIFLDSELPIKLRKHFRCREGNLVRKSRLADVAPDLPGLDNFQHSHRFTHHERFEELLRLLLPLDYALVIQKTPNKDGVNHSFELTHFHVKIERLMDNALRGLGVYLNYFKRGLYERGDSFIDAFEKKFYEYFNFYHNAAGRRSAAALAAQLFARERIPATVYVASQQTRRLTLLTTSSENQEVTVEQYLLLRLNKKIFKNLKSWGKEQDLSIQRHFMVNPHKKKQGVFVFRAGYEHTPAARPSRDGSLKSELNSREKWIRLVDERLIPIREGETTQIGYPMVYRRSFPEESPI